MTLGIFSSDFGHSSSKRFPTKWLFPAVTSPIQTVIVKLKSAWPSRRRAARESAANVLNSNNKNTHSKILQREITDRQLRAHDSTVRQEVSRHLRLSVKRQNRTTEEVGSPPGLTDNFDYDAKVFGVIFRIFCFYPWLGNWRRRSRGLQWTRSVGGRCQCRSEWPRSRSRN